MGRRPLVGGRGRWGRRGRRQRQRRRGHGGRRGGAALGHRARRRAVRRDDGQDERREQEEPGAPPRDLRQQGRRLAAPHELFGARAPPERRQPATLPGLEEDGGREQQRVAGQDEQEERVHPAG